MKRTGEQTETIMRKREKQLKRQRKIAAKNAKRLGTQPRRDN